MGWEPAMVTWRVCSMAVRLDFALETQWGLEKVVMCLGQLKVKAMVELRVVQWEPQSVLRLDMVKEILSARLWDVRRVQASVAMWVEP